MRQTGPSAAVLRSPAIRLALPLYLDSLSTGWHVRYFLFEAFVAERPSDNNQLHCLSLIHVERAVQTEGSMTDFLSS